MKILWSGASRYHDWFNNKNEIPREIFKSMKSLKVFEDIQWFYEGTDDEEKKVVDNKDFDINKYLLKVKEKRNGSYCLNIGSSKPYDWYVNLLLFPFVSSIQQVRGINTFNYYFENESYLSDKDSDLLYETFKKTHNTRNTEFAMLHPYQKYSELTDVISGHYQDPLTFSPMFNGVFWVTFLGEEHLNFFDLEKLKNIQCYQHEWINAHKGLYLRVSKNIAQCVKSEIEEKMFSLTEAFRDALK